MAANQDKPYAFCCLGNGEARVFAADMVKRDELMLRFPTYVVFPITREQSRQIVNGDNNGVELAYEIWKGLL